MPEENLIPDTEAPSLFREIEQLRVSVLQHYDLYIAEKTRAESAETQVRQMTEAIEWVLPYLKDMWRKEVYEVPGPAITALAEANGDYWSHRDTIPSEVEP